MPGTPFRSYNTRAAKLDAEQVREIRRLYASGWTQARLCREFNIGTAQIGKIVRRESWRNLPKTEDELREEAKLSAQRFAEKYPELISPAEGMSQAVAAERTRQGAGDRLLGEAAKDDAVPPSPLEE